MGFSKFRSRESRRSQKESVARCSLFPHFFSLLFSMHLHVYICAVISCMPLCVIQPCIFLCTYRLTQHNAVLLSVSGTLALSRSLSVSLSPSLSLSLARSRCVHRNVYTLFGLPVVREVVTEATVPQLWESRPALGSCSCCGLCVVAARCGGQCC